MQQDVGQQLDEHHISQYSQENQFLKTKRQQAQNNRLVQQTLLNYLTALTPIVSLVELTIIRTHICA